MILIPEIETVLILVPRTGTASLRRAVRMRYPNAMHVYRHMEADGVPIGYENWRKIGVVRHPLDRMWSLYKFMKGMMGNYDPKYIEAMQRSTSVPFDVWIRDNTERFVMCESGGKFWPHYVMLHDIPENAKSQWVYLRPDLGTVVFPYGHIATMAIQLGLRMPIGTNATDKSPPPPISEETQDYMTKVFSWDLEAARGLQ